MLRNCYIFDSDLRIFLEGYGLKALIPGTTGRVFRAVTRCVATIDPPDRQRHIKLRAEGTAMPLEIVGGCLYTMMNVDRMDLPRPLLGACQEQGSRIGAATESHRQW